MHLIVGLGNPGSKYAQTRHNIGFLFLDFLAERHGLRFSDSKWKAKVCKAGLWGEKLLLAKPETYMNSSGEAVGRIASYYKIDPPKVMAVHDDLDLDPGRLKMVFNRGAGGHNGIISMISHLSAKSFSRIRMGIGRPEVGGMPVKNFVLSKFTPQEMTLLEERFLDMEKGVRLFVEQGESAAMNYLNSLS